MLDAVSRLPGLCAIVALMLGPGGAAAQWVHPLEFPQPEGYPEAIVAVVEIPEGSFTKYEIDKDTGHIIVDRYQSMPVRYPANYGAIPSTRADDGDALDVLVLAREPIAPGAFIRVRPVGVLQMIDGGEQDHKIIAVPVSDVDPAYDHLLDVFDLPEIERQRIEAFSRIYKDLPEGRKLVELQGFLGAIAAMTMVRRAIEAYRLP